MNTVEEQITLIPLLDPKSRQIGHEVYYPVPMHTQACFSSLSHHTGDFPISEAAVLTTVAIPVYPELTATQQQVVVTAVVEYCAS